MSHKDCYEKREEITERLTAMTRERDEWERRCKTDYKKFTEEIASLREVNAQLAEDAVILRSQLAAEKAQVAALTSDLYKSRNDAAAWKESFTTEHALVAALTEKLEAAKRLTAPHLQEYAMRLEDENKKLTEKVAGMVANNNRVCSIVCQCGGRHDGTCEDVRQAMREAEEDSLPILAAHDAAKQAELIEALRKWVAWVHPDTMEEGHSAWPMVDESRAILSKYPKAAKEGA